MMCPYCEEEKELKERGIDLAPNYTTLMCDDCFEKLQVQPHEDLPPGGTSDMP